MSTSGRDVTRSDIEAKIEEIRASVTPKTEVTADVGKGAIVGATVLGVVVAYLFGRRHGRKRSTVVEIRRI